MAEEDEEKIESVRAARPGSYMFKIQSFSLLSSYLPFDRYLGSPEFESGGRKWRLIIYPNGDCEQKVDDHISMYLVATDDYIDSVGFEVNCTLKMFVYDHLRDNFLTVQDTEVKRFHRSHKESGFARLISLERFKDAENGYLVNDSCLFGVEIFVIPSLVHEGCLSVINEPKDGIFTWKLDNFSTLEDDVYYSEIFNIQGHQWKLKMYPNGTSIVKNTHLSLYLQPHSLDIHGNSVVYAKGVLRLRNHLNDKHHECKLMHCFDDALNEWGYPQYILLEDARNISKGFILDDSVTFEVEINCISKTCFL